MEHLPIHHPTSSVDPDASGRRGRDHIFACIRRRSDLHMIGAMRSCSDWRQPRERMDASDESAYMERASHEYDTMTIESEQSRGAS